MLLKMLMKKTAVGIPSRLILGASVRNADGLKSPLLCGVGQTWPHC